MVLKRPMLSFVLLSCIIFLGLFSLTGVSMALRLPAITTEIVKIISAWSSTFAFLILFRRIYPGVRLSDFIKEKFAQRINFRVVVSIIILQSVIYVTTIALLPDTQTIIDTIASTGVATTISVFLWHLLWGPLGEQLGWRGYMLNELHKEYSPLTAALIKGVLWGFWHAPLWLVSGYTGMHLLKYSLFFMILMISASVIIAFFYRLNHTLLIPIVIHQMLNFFTYGITGELLQVEIGRAHV